MNDIESLRRKKLEALKKKAELQPSSAQQTESETQQNNSDAKLLAIARQVCDEKAYDRLTNIKAVNPALFSSAIQTCASVFQRYQRKIDDKTLVQVLSLINSRATQQGSIEFKRK